MPAQTRFAAGFGNQRGVALPMALISLVLLTTLMLAFAVLSQTEPVIAANQLRVTQARALAESGFERAIWALSNPAEPRGIPSPMPGDVAAAPYDGSTFILVAAAGVVTTGGFTVRVEANPARPNERKIIAEGWTPTNDPTDLRTKAHRQIGAIVEQIPDMGLQAPCALCVRGALDLAGNSAIDATLDVSCGNKVGTFTRDATARAGSAQIRGADGNNIANQPTDLQERVPDDRFNAFTLSPTALDRLKRLARRKGTYWGPGFPNGGFVSDGSATWSGKVTFNAGNQVGNGIVFVDTVTGQNITDETPDDDLATVLIHGAPFEAGAFTGWLVVNGALTITGSMTMNGMIYVVNDFTYNGTGAGEINGLVISQNVRDADATSVDTSARGNSKVKFNCANARGGGQVPTTFELVAGSYQECREGAPCPASPPAPW